jgi:hypothetical protein
MPHLFITERVAVDQIIDLRTTLRYLGVPVIPKSFMFGNIQAVVTNSSIPNSSLDKRHSALAYHFVCEMISAKILEEPSCYCKKALELSTSMASPETITILFW